MSPATLSQMGGLAKSHFRHDFSALHDAMQRYVDDEILPGVSAAVLAGRDLVDVHLYDPSD